MSNVATIQEQRPSLLSKFASKYSVEPAKMMSTLKATCFKVKNGEATNEQMMALLIVADQYSLNPFTKEIFAFPDKQNGIVPVVGVDGWSRIINDHPQFDGMDFNESDEKVTPDGAKPCPEWIECVIYRKDRAHPIKVKEYIDEVYRAPFKGSGQNGSYEVAGPWQSHTKRFLRHKALIQCARIAFGFVGIYDEDEAQRIIEKDITPASEVVTDKSDSRTSAIKEKLKRETVAEVIQSRDEEPLDTDDFVAAMDAAEQ
jgi:phage recombination protein Bet